MIYDKITIKDLKDRCLNIQESTKVIITTACERKEKIIKDLKPTFTFDYFEVMAIKDGDITLIKLYR